MIRFIFRALATIALAAAVLAGLLDATRTVARDELVATPIGSDLALVAPQWIATVREAVAGYPLVPTLVDGLLALPAWIVFAVLALVFGALGQIRRARPRFLVD